jgi:hypothetical protein
LIFLTAWRTSRRQQKSIHKITENVFVRGANRRVFLDHLLDLPGDPGWLLQKLPVENPPAGIDYLSICGQAKTESQLPTALPPDLPWHHA